MLESNRSIAQIAAHLGIYRKDPPNLRIKGGNGEVAARREPRWRLLCGQSKMKCEQL
ncbi:hypothetical protein BJ999_003538 [Actinomadura citrea]|uniref:Uncharacterized protein n=1 Tax=Actinomadura citrea TaxID=46158 RepID=A0A7Y9GB30_9ACTN|nr:hypothetical protein [Actinomadura citrea]GGU04985.1 hypothetical protein GCM10010177_75440 [Actinomadura citrea]